MSVRLKERHLDPVIARGLALAALVVGFGIMAGALATGGNVIVIAVGLFVAGFSMDLFRICEPRDGE